MKYILKKEKIFYTLFITLLCLFVLGISGIFNYNITATSIDGIIYGNKGIEENAKIIISIVLSFWLGLLFPVIFIKSK
jgi:hypothetical protein